MEGEMGERENRRVVRKMGEQKFSELKTGAETIGWVEKEGKLQVWEREQKRLV